MKPSRERVYLFITRSRPRADQILVLSHIDPDLWCGVQTPGGSIERGESPEAAALREAFEETGLTHIGPPILLAQDVYENEDEVLQRYFFRLPISVETEDEWVHRVYGEGIDSGLEFRLRWVDLPHAEDLASHFRAYMEML